MKAEDFMRGNYVLCRGALSRIDAIFENQVSYKKISDDKGEPSIPLKFVQPIPLNESELERLGFSYVSNKNGQLYYCHYESGSMLLFSYGSWNWSNSPSTTIGAKLEYTHQLQNLFKSLIGKQLVYVK